MDVAFTNKTEDRVHLIIDNRRFVSFNLWVWGYPQLILTQRSVCIVSVIRLKSLYTLLTDSDLTGTLRHTELNCNVPMLMQR